MNEINIIFSNFSEKSPDDTFLPFSATRGPIYRDLKTITRFGILWASGAFMRVCGAGGGNCQRFSAKIIQREEKFCCCCFSFFLSLSLPLLPQFPCLWLQWISTKSRLLLEIAKIQICFWHVPERTKFQITPGNKISFCLKPHQEQAKFRSDSCQKKNIYTSW